MFWLRIKKVNFNYMYAPLSYNCRRHAFVPIILSFISCRVKSGIFGQIAKFGQPLYLFHSSIIGIKID